MCVNVISMMIQSDKSVTSKEALHRWVSWHLETFCCQQEHQIKWQPIRNHNQAYSHLTQKLIRSAVFLQDTQGNIFLMLSICLFSICLPQHFVMAEWSYFQQWHKVVIINGELIGIGQIMSRLSQISWNME